MSGLAKCDCPAIETLCFYFKNQYIVKGGYMPFGQ